MYGGGTGAPGAAVKGWNRRGGTQGISRDVVMTSLKNSYRDFVFRLRK